MFLLAVHVGSSSTATSNNNQKQGVMDQLEAANRDEIIHTWLNALVLFLQYICLPYRNHRIQ